MTQGETHAPAPEDLQWALDEARRGVIPGAAGWFRAWPTGDEKWASVNIRSAAQVIVNHTLVDRDPNQWTVRAVFGTKAVELHLGPYEDRMRAVLVAHAVLHLATA
jgi:hypothetical protein